MEKLGKILKMSFKCNHQTKCIKWLGCELSIKHVETKVQGIVLDTTLQNIAFSDNV